MGSFEDIPSSLFEHPRWNPSTLITYKLLVQLLQKNKIDVFKSCVRRFEQTLSPSLLPQVFTTTISRKPGLPVIRMFMESKFIKTINRTHLEHAARIGDMDVLLYLIDHPACTVVDPSSYFAAACNETIECGDYSSFLQVEERCSATLNYERLVKTAKMALSLPIYDRAHRNIYRILLHLRHTNRIPPTDNPLLEEIIACNMDEAGINIVEAPTELDVLLLEAAIYHAFETNNTNLFTALQRTVVMSNIRSKYFNFFHFFRRNLSEIDPFLVPDLISTIWSILEDLQ